MDIKSENADIKQLICDVYEVTHLFPVVSERESSCRPASGVRDENKIWLLLHNLRSISRCTHKTYMYHVRTQSSRITSGFGL